MRKPKTKPEFNCYQVSTAAYQAYGRKDFKTAAKLLLNCKSNLEKLGEKEESAAYAFWLIGISLYMSEKYTQCEPYLVKAGRIYKNLKKPDLLNCLWWRGVTLQQLKQYKKAAASFRSCSNWATNNGLKDSDWPCRAYSQIGFCLWQAKDFKGAFDAFAKCIEVSKKASLHSVSSLVEKLMQLHAADSTASDHVPQLRQLATRASKIVSRKLVEHSNPATESHSVRERRFGHVVDDPYRWLEDIHSPEVRKWMDQQMESSKLYIESIPGRTEMWTRIHKMFSVKPLKITYKSGAYYFTANSPLTRLYRTDKLGKFPKLVLSSDELPKDCSIQHTTISRSGKYVAYWVMTKGSDWQSVYVKNMSTGKRVTGVLKNLRACNIIWAKDDSGFYYAAFSRESSHCQIKFHKLGTAQARDKTLFTIEDPDVYAGISMVGDSKYLMVTTYGTKRDRHSIFLINIKSARHKRVIVLDEQSHNFSFIGQKEGRLFFITDKNAPMFRIVSCSVEDIEQSSKVNRRPKFREELAEKRDSLKRAFNWGEFLVSVYFTKTGEVIERFNTTTKKQLEPIKLPGGTSVLSIHYMAFPIIRLVVEGYTVPTMIYELNIKTGKLVPKSPFRSTLDMKQFVTEKLYARSADGSKIPFYVRYKKGLKLNGNNPTILTGYGGFDRDINASFDNYDLLWMNLGGVCVESVLRGDSGLGAEWRKGGMREHKQRTFEDFIAVAEALIRKKYTQPSRLGIYGYSNGGLLTGAALTQRPDLFGAVEIGCALLDMLRFHKFGTEKHFVSEYGSAATKKFFEILRDYSPLHNVSRTEYPPVLINTGSHDDRVCPAHSYKFAATLQQNQTGHSPILLNIEMDAGHSFSSKSNMGVNRLAFFGYELGLIPKVFLS